MRKQNEARSRGPSLDLVPASTQYWKDNPDDLQIILAYALAGLVAVVVIAAAIYIGVGVFAIGMAAAEGALGIEAGVFLAGLARTMPQVLATAYGAVGTACTVGGQSMPALSGR
jgi:hypothetical protein